MLVMAIIYNLPRLRLLCVKRLGNEPDGNQRRWLQSASIALLARLDLNLYKRGTRKRQHGSRLEAGTGVGGMIPGLVHTPILRRGFKTM